MKDNYTSQLKAFSFCCLFTIFSLHLSAQVGIGTTNPNPNALLDLDASTTPGGLLLPRIALSGTTSFAPMTANVEGMVVYNTATTSAGPNQVTPGYYYNDGSQWVRVGNSSSTDWTILGNASTTPGTGAGENYLGTSDGKDLVLATTASERVRVLSTGEVGIGINNPDDKLDVVGNTQVSGYLRIGNPAVPQVVTNGGLSLLYTAGSSDFYNEFYTIGGCGTAVWGAYVNPNSSSSYLEFDPSGSRGKKYMYSPSVWVPSNATVAYIELFLAYVHAANDGVFLEYSIDNGANWNLIPAANFLQGGYNGFITGSNNNCTNNGVATQAWTGNVPGGVFSIISLSVSGTWLQLRFTGMENQNTGGGTGFYFDMYNMNIMSNASGASTGGAFAAGNIYSEKNIYAGSNVMLGDLAEYFPVIGRAEKGDIIAYTKGNRDIFSISTKENDEKIIGVYSSNPTLTLNNPNSGLPVALQGRVPVNVVGEEIKKGEYLMASSVPGKAMKANKSGFLIGRALEDFKGGKGQIICLVETGWKNLNSGQNQVSNSSSLPVGTSKITVRDNSINTNSKIFVSFKGNIGSNHWIDNVTNGSFDLNLGNDSPSNVIFDYLIENASNSTTISEINKVSGEDDLVSGLNQPKNTMLPERQSTLSGASKKELREMDESAVPPSVPDPEKGYVWTQSNGLKESSSLEAKN